MLYLRLVVQFPPGIHRRDSSLTYEPYVIFLFCYAIRNVQSSLGALTTRREQRLPLLHIAGQEEAYRNGQQRQP